MLGRQKMLPLEARMDLFRTMAQYETDGKSLLNLFRAKSKRAKERKVPYGKIIIEIHHKLDVVGLGVSDALKDYIPHDEYMFLQLAERRASSVGEMLEAVVRMTVKKLELQNRIITASLTPIVIYIAMHILVLVLIYAVYPPLSGIIEDVTVEGFPGFFIYKVIPFLQYFFIPIAILSISLLFLNILSLPYLSVQPFRATLDRFSVINKLYREFVGANILMTMGASLQTGSTLIDFFKTYSRVSDPYFKGFCDKISSRLQDGSYSPAESLDIDLFAIEDMEKIYDYTSSGGDVSDSLSQIGQNAVDVSTIRIERRLKFIFRIMVVIIFLILGLFIYSLGKATALGMAAN
jgi:type II secretory pathway component PulF